MTDAFDLLTDTYQQLARQIKLTARKPTQKDVAQHAGVSQAAVSAVLSGDGGGVSPAVQERIRHSAEALNYIPNRNAQALKTNRSMVVACIVPDISNPFYPPMIRAVERVVGPAGYDVIALSTDGETASERRMLDLCLDRRVAGIVGVFFRTRARELAALADGDIAIVRYESAPKPGGNLAIDDYFVDNQQAAHDLASRLISLGHSDIAFLASPGGPEAARIAGYSKALDSAGLPLRIVHAESYSIDGGERTTQRLLETSTRPTAIMCAEDLLACGAVRACRNAGLNMPREMSITGFNNLAMTEIFNPALTTVSLSQELFGYLAGKRLLARISGAATGPGEVFSLPSTIVARASMAPPGDFPTPQFIDDQDGQPTYD